MRRPSSTQTILWPFLAGALLSTASCGNFQDPASGLQATTLSQPSVSPPAPLQQIGGSESQLTLPPPAYAVIPASLPAPTGTAPASTNTFGTGPRSDTLVTPPPHSGTTQLSTNEENNWPRTKSVNFGWDPSPSGNAKGYKVYVTAVPGSMQYVYDVSSETQLKVTLPIGMSYKFTVIAYNAAGDSPPASDFHFDLF